MDSVLAFHSRRPPPCQLILPDHTHGPLDDQRLCMLIQIQQLAPIMLVICDLVKLQSPGFGLLRDRLRDLEDQIHIPRKWNEPVVTS